MIDIVWFAMLRGRIALNIGWHEDRAAVRAYGDRSDVTLVPESVPFIVTFLGAMSVVVVIFGLVGGRRGCRSQVARHP